MDLNTDRTLVYTLRINVDAFHIFLHGVVDGLVAVGTLNEYGAPVTEAATSSPSRTTLTYALALASSRPLVTLLPNIRSTMVYGINRRLEKARVYTDIVLCAVVR